MYAVCYSSSTLPPLFLVLDMVHWSSVLPSDLFFQVFESVEEVEQIEMEPKNEEAKQGSKIANGAVQNGTTSPDSGHPSSRNFSVTSVLSDGSLSTEDNAVPDTTPRSGSVSLGTQSPIKPAGAKTQVLPEESPECNVRDPNEEEEAKAVEKEMTTPLSLEKKMEEGSKTQGSVEFEAVETKEINDLKTNLPPEVRLAEREDSMTSAPEAPEVEKSLIFSAHPGTACSSETNFTAQRDVAPTMTESDESPSAIEMEEIPKAKVSMVPWSRKGRCEESPLSEEQQGKASPEGTESLLSDEPEMENLYPNFDSGPEITKNDNKAETPSQMAGSPLTVRTVLLVFTGLICPLHLIILPPLSQQELLDLYTLNLHRIEKDVQRCDRNYWYFTPANLEKLRNIMCRYILVDYKS